tara:strand:+ start:1016 stop:1177 length:162 start_codon:yes stop_codon:yes gene_type:complete
LGLNIYNHERITSIIAIQYIKKAAWLKGGLYELKSTIKGAEVHNIIKDVISGI